MNYVFFPSVSGWNNFKTRKWILNKKLHSLSSLDVNLKFQQLLETTESISNSSLALHSLHLFSTLYYRLDSSIKKQQRIKFTTQSQASYTHFSVFLKQHVIVNVKPLGTFTANILSVGLTSLSCSKHTNAIMLSDINEE